MRIKRYVVSSASAGIANALGSAIAVMTLLPLIIRNVGMEVYGIWAICGMFVALSAALELGVSKALILLTARGEMDESRQVVVDALLLVTLVAVTALGMILMAGEAEIEFGTPTAIPADLRAFIWTSGFVVVLTGLWLSVFRGLLEARLRLGFVNYGFLVFTVAQYGAVWLVSTQTADPRALILATVASYVGAAILHGVASFRIVGFPANVPSIRRSGRVLAVSLPLFAIAAPTVVMYPVLGAIVLSTAASSAEYGQYDIAVRLSTLCATAVASIGVPVLGLIAGGYMGSGRRLGQLVSQTTVLSGIVGLVGIATFVAAGAQLLEVLFGPQDQGLFRASLVMMFGTVSLAVAEPITRALYAARDFAPIVIARCAILAIAVAGALIASSPVLMTVSVGYGMAFLVAAVGMQLYWWGWARCRPLGTVAG
jgi:hypothetical protein